MCPLSSHTRRVHQVRLSAPSQDLVWRGRNLLEDALHTVSLPAAETSQLLFIRHFNVGTIHSNQSATRLSVSLAAKLQQLSEIALPGTHPAAATAPAVIFPDDLSAYTHFAYRLATGHRIGQSPSQSLSAWFWPCLLPHWHPTHPAPEAAIHLLAHLATHEIAPLATATVLRQLHIQQALTPFLSLLRPQHGSKLLADHGWRLPNPDISIAPNSRSLYQEQPLLLQARPPHWTAQDPRTLWLAAMGLIAQRPTVATMPNLIAIAQQQINASFAEPTPNHEPAESTHQHPSIHPDPPATNLSPDDLVISPLTGLLQSSPTQNKVSHTPSSTTEAFSTTERDLSVRATLDEPRTEETHSSDISSPPSAELQTTPSPGIHTDYAGLIYLLNLLTYLHFPTYLPRYNHPHFPHLLLLYTALRQGVPTHDPILSVFADDSFLTHNPLNNTHPETALHSLITHHSSLIIPLTAWYSAVRHWLRHHTLFTLADLIHRPAILTLTPTHLDLTFDLTQVDIHIRRAGLDLNPGWLPWLGRVVQFHYQDTCEAILQRGDTP